METRSITIRELVDVVGVHILIWLRIWRRVSSKCVQKLLRMEQKELCVEVLYGILDCSYGNSYFPKTIITGDEPWMFGYDP